MEKYHAINASERMVFFACVMTQAVLAIFEKFLLCNIMYDKIYLLAKTMKFANRYEALRCGMKK